MSLPEQMTGLQALAWLCWRTESAVRIFGGAGAGLLWAAARNGDFPAGLGKPIVTPIAAEHELARAMGSGELPYRYDEPVEQEPT